MNKATLLLTVCLALFTLPVNAAEPDKQAALEKLFEVMDIDRQMSGGFEAMLPIIENTANQFKLDAEARAELTEIYRDWYLNDLDHTRVRSQMLDLYANAFTLQEIEETTQFYQTPLGQKLTQISPELMKQGAQIGMIEAQSKQQKLIDKLQPFFKAQSKK